MPHLQAGCAAIEARQAVDRAPIGAALLLLPVGPERAAGQPALCLHTQEVYIQHFSMAYIRVFEIILRREVSLTKVLEMQAVACQFPTDVALIRYRR